MNEGIPTTKAEAMEIEYEAIADLQAYEGTADGLEMAPQLLRAAAALNRLQRRCKELREHLRVLNALGTSRSHTAAVCFYAATNWWDPRPSRLRERREQFIEEFEALQEEIGEIQEAIGTVRE